MSTLRFVSPERRWRAGLLVVPAAWLGWRAAEVAGIFVGSAAAAAVLSLVVPTMRSCLIITDDLVVDRRALRQVQVPWREIAEFRVQRPGWLWGGFCVVAARWDGREVDLLSTRVYARAPLTGHLDELHRMCWTLEDMRARREENTPSDT